jgi:multiple sugar transport system permease protein
MSAATQRALADSIGPGPARPPRGGIAARSEAIAGYAFIAIPMVLFLVLNIASLFYALFISVWKWSPLKGPTQFLGMANYGSVVNDPYFQTAVGNTLYYTVIWVPLTMAIGLFLAVIVNQRIRGKTFFRAAFYFPSIASSAAITTLFIFLVNPEGLFNGVRGVLGLNPLFQLFGYGPNQDWVGDYRTALNSVIILNAWTTSGTFMLFYLASLQAISHEVYEAAAIDGASAWQIFWQVTFPLLRPGHFFVATVGLIGGLQLFDQAFIVGSSNGDPAHSLLTIVLYLYNMTFNQLNFGVAAAMGVVLFVIIFGLTLVQRQVFGRTPAY